MIMVLPKPVGQFIQQTHMPVLYSIEVLMNAWMVVITGTDVARPAWQQWLARKDVYARGADFHF